MRRLVSASLATAALVAGASAASRAENPPKTQAEAPVADAAKTKATHLYADGFLVWIYRAPVRDIAPIGYLRAGQSARFRELTSDTTTARKFGARPAGSPVTRRGCSGGWYAVEPAGFVCNDRLTSLEPTRYTRSMAGLAARPGPYPFDYALSMGTPSYRRVPTADEWPRRERKFGKATSRPLPPHWRGHEELVTDEQLARSAVPWFLEGSGSVSRAPEKRLQRREVPFGSMLAVTGSFELNGRRYLQSADGTAVPAERMRMFKRSSFEGVDLDDPSSLDLPLAWPRKKSHRYSLADEDCELPAIAEGDQRQLWQRPPSLPRRCLERLETWARPRHVLELTGRRVEISGTRFVELKPGTNSSPTGTATTTQWLPESYVYIARSTDAPSKSLDKWLHFSIGRGTLVAYRGSKPVFATLASPGIGGLPKKGGDALSDRTTPLGTHRIMFKHVTDDMSPEVGEHRSFWIADVPYAMYFKQPFAIHVAYWHESFGEPMSGGCINVSPKDGARLFNWTDPPLPEGWYGVGASREFGLGTTVHVTR